MKKDVVGNALSALGETTKVYDPYKFFKENSDDIDFLWFLRSMFNRMVEVETATRDQLEKEIGSSIASAFEEVYNHASFKVDKNRLSNVLYCDDLEEMKKEMLVFLRTCEKIEE